MLLFLLLCCIIKAEGYEMKKITVWTIAVVVLISCTVLCFVYRDDLGYLATSMRRIELNKNTTTQSIITYNVRCITDADEGEFAWKKRASLICDLLQENTPSIICMQENKEKQYEFFKKYLKGYNTVATYRDDSSLKECIPIFFRDDMYELVETQTFWLSDTPDTMSNTWDAAYFRICTFVILKNKTTNKQFIIGNTHLDYENQEIQAKSIQLICDRLIPYNLPTIIMGDFNCTPDSKAIDIAKQHFVDVGQGFEDETKGTVNYFKEDYQNIKIDFMFQLPNSFSINKYQVIDKKYKGHYASDHFPIYAEIN